MSKNTFEQAYFKLLDLIEELKLPYLVIGGLGTGVLGEPRFTLDIDISLKLSQKELSHFLKGAIEKGFTCNKEGIYRAVRTQGTFRLISGRIHIDIIVASTKFEASALRRGKKIRLFGRFACFPSPEDLIIMKLIPGRGKDLIDAESIMIRHKDRRPCVS